MRSYARDAMLIAAAALLASELPGAALAQQAQPVECVQRSATATPPPHPAGPRRAASKKAPAAPPEQEAAPRPKPVCPEGQVPVIQEQKIQADEKRVPMKGNPLLQPRPGEARPSGIETKGAVSPNDVRTFEEIYGRRGKRTKGRGTAPSQRGGALPGRGFAASCPATCYYYGSAGLPRAADGGGMTMSVNRPNYDASSIPGHTLDEIAIQAGTKNGNIVEIGWLVSTDQNGDADPHIFVFHWKDWQATCYNGCGWQQYSNTYYPGQTIASLVGREVYIGYVFWKGNWWAWFDDQWLGYFPGSEWNNQFTKSALIQWFGEVASANTVPSKTQMGDGVLPPSLSAAHMFTLCDVDAAAWVCWFRDQQSLSATVGKYYDIRRTGFGETRYGGPGH